MARNGKLVGSRAEPIEISDDEHIGGGPDEDEVMVVTVAQTKAPVVATPVVANPSASAWPTRLPPRVMDTRFCKSITIPPNWANDVSDYEISDDEPGGGDGGHDEDEAMVVTMAQPEAPVVATPVEAGLSASAWPTRLPPRVIDTRFCKSTGGSMPNPGQSTNGDTSSLKRKLADRDMNSPDHTDVANNYRQPPPPPVQLPQPPQQLHHQKQKTEFEVVIPGESKKARKRCRRMERELSELPRRASNHSTMPSPEQILGWSAPYQETHTMEYATYGVSRSQIPLGGFLPMKAGPSTSTRVQRNGVGSAVAQPNTGVQRRPSTARDSNTTISSASVPATSPTFASSAVAPAQEPPHPRLPARGFKSRTIGIPHTRHDDGCFIPLHGYKPVQARTLVMQLIPKKLRNLVFLRSWYLQFGEPIPVHVELDKDGRALIEFPSVARAKGAFNSPRYMGDKGNIRVCWYRVNEEEEEREEGEIEEGAPPVVPTKPTKSSKMPAEPPMSKKKMRQKKWQEAQEEVKRVQARQGSVRRDIALERISTTTEAKDRHQRDGLPKSAHSSGSMSISPSTSSIPLPPRPTTHSSFYVAALQSLHDVPSGEIDMDVDTEMDKLEGGSRVDGPESISSSRNSSPQPSPVPAFSDVPPPSTSVPVFDGNSYSIHTEPISTLSARLSLCVPVGMPAPSAGASSSSRASVLTNFSVVGDVRNAAREPIGSETPPSTSSTPGAPSEPRATRNAPNGPSMWRKVKEAEGSNGIEETGTQTIPDTTPPATNIGQDTEHQPKVSSEHPQPILAPKAPVSKEKAAREERLRNLVLATKRKKVPAPEPEARKEEPQPPAPPPKPKHLANVVASITADFVSAAPHPATLTAIVARPSASGPVNGNSNKQSMESSTPSDASIALPTPSLEDLAISFITDAIRSVSPDHHMAAKSVPTSQVPPPPKTISAWETKQKRLERHILESKALMTQLGEARTKTERDQILGLLREKNRLMDSEADGRQEDGQDKYNVTPRPGFSRHGSSRWPETSYEATVLIVSDDEDEEEEEEEEADAVEGMVC